MQEVGFIASIIFVITLFALYYIYIKRKKYTKERFAFVSISLLFSFGVLVLSHIFYENSLLILITSLLNQFLSLSIPIPTTDWTGKILSVLIFIVFATVIGILFSSWDGGKSFYEYKLNEKHKEIKYLEAVLQGLKSLNINVFDEKHTLIESEKNEILDYFNINKDWHSESREILKLISNQYKIHENEWHSEKSLYISSYSEKPIAIFCSLEKPTNDSIIEKIDFLKTFFNDIEFIKLIVMVKNTDEIKYNTVINGLNIEFRYKNELLDSLVDFSEYFDYIKDEYLNKEITDGDKLRLQDIYTNPRGKIVDTNHVDNEVIDNLEQYILSWTKDETTPKHISLLGEYGQGKSVLSLKLAYEMILQKSSRIPIIIELRGKSPKTTTYLEIISNWASRFNISPKSIEKLMHAGKLLIILEGFDEMDLIGDSYTRSLHFKRLLEFMRFKKSKVIITGRPNLFLDTDEMKKFLQFDKDGNQLFYTEPIHLLPLNKEQIKFALRKTNDNIKNEILSFLDEEKANESFIDLISRPSTLYQTSVIWESLDKSNINSASVINEFIRHSYRRQADKLRTIGATGVAPVLTIDEREYFMMGIAVSMIKQNEYTNQISKSDLQETIKKLYANIPDEVSADDENGISLQERFKDNINSLDTVFNDVRTSGLLVMDLAKDGNFKFAHKSFLEFIFAKFYVFSILQQDNINTKVVNSIANALNIINIYRSEFSNEVIGFISTLFLNNMNTKTSNTCICENILNIILPNKFQKKFSSFILRKGFRKKVKYFFIISFLTIGLTIFIGDKNITIFLMISTALIQIITMYLLQQSSPARLRQPIKIWYKTCEYSESEEAIYNAVNKDYIYDLLENNNSNHNHKNYSDFIEYMMRDFIK